MHGHMAWRTIHKSELQGISADGATFRTPSKWAGLMGSDPGHAFFEMSVLVVRLRLVLESLSIRPNRARV